MGRVSKVGVVEVGGPLRAYLYEVFEPTRTISGEELTFVFAVVSLDCYLGRMLKLARKSIYERDSFPVSS